MEEIFPGYNKLYECDKQCLTLEKTSCSVYESKHFSRVVNDMFSKRIRKHNAFYVPGNVHLVYVDKNSLDCPNTFPSHMKERFIEKNPKLKKWMKTDIKTLLEKDDIEIAENDMDIELNVQNFPKCRFWLIRTGHFRWPDAAGHALGAYVDFKLKKIVVFDPNGISPKLKQNYKILLNFSNDGKLLDYRKKKFSVQSFRMTYRIAEVIKDTLKKHTGISLKYNIIELGACWPGPQKLAKQNKKYDPRKNICRPERELFLILRAYYSEKKLKDICQLLYGKDDPAKVVRTFIAWVVENSVELQNMKKKLFKENCPKGECELLKMFPNCF